MSENSHCEQSEAILINSFLKYSIGVGSNPELSRRKPTYLIKINPSALAKIKKTPDTPLSQPHLIFAL